MKKLFSSDRYEIKIALIYFVISVCWIFFSDQVLNMLVADQVLQLQLQTYKGWGFVIVTTFVLYIFIRRDALKLRASKKRIEQLLGKEKDSREKVEREKERLKEMLLEAPSAICILEGPEHRYKYANDQYRQLVGERDLIGLTGREALPELQGQGFFELLDKVYETKEPHKGNEIPFVIDSDGRKQTYYRDFIYKPLINENGDCTGIFVEAIDVTEEVQTRKRLEESIEEKRVLLIELHHRVKNNLALITGLIELEANEYQDKLKVIPLETTRNRIFAIAEIHELLFQQQSLKNIPFHKFLDRLLEILFSSGEENNYPSVELKRDELKLNINQAVPLGLMINEILSWLSNGNSRSACEDIRLVLNIQNQKEVLIKFHIRQFNQEVKEKIINPEKYLPATLLQVLSKQLSATLDHRQDGDTDVIEIRFQKGEKKGAASNI